MARAKEQAEDKTGGTPDGGRMEPGKEGRGGARRQRRPELFATLEGAAKKLADQCLQVASHMGHNDCALWQVNEAGDSGQIRCGTCRKTGGFALYPMWHRIPDDSDPEGKKMISVQRDQLSGIIVEGRCGK